MRRTAFVPTGILAFGLAASGQGFLEPMFYTDSRLVLLPVSVVDRHGAPVPGLRADSFTVTQDGLPQRILSVSEEEMPVSIGIVFDESGSMRPVMDEAKAVVGALLRSANEADEAFLFTVSTRPGMEGTFDRDLGSVLERAAFARAGGATALVDTLYGALRAEKAAHNGKRALVVISDGMDNHSRYTKGDLLSMAEESGTAVYSLCIFEPPNGKKPIELREEREGAAFLEELSHRTGGIPVVAQHENAVKAARQLSDAIHYQYLVGYNPGEKIRVGVRHSIHVTMNAPGARAYTRSGVLFNSGVE
jgi:VWFA-related protein